MTPIEIGLTVAVVVLAVMLTSGVITAYAAWECLLAIIGQQRDRIGHLEREVAEVRDTLCGTVDDEDDEWVAGIEERFDETEADVEGMKARLEEIARTCDEVNGRLAIRNAQKNRIDELQAAVQELTAKHLPVHASHDLLTALESQIAELRNRLTRSVGLQETDSDRIHQAHHRLSVLEKTVAGMQVNREVLTEPTEPIAAGNWIVRDASGFETTARVRVSDPDELRYGRWTAIFWPYHGLTYTRMFDRVGQEHSGWTLVRREIGYVRPEAFADSAHAACPDPRWKSDCEPAVVADEDDQVTELGEPTFVTVDERAET